MTTPRRHAAYQTDMDYRQAMQDAIRGQLGGELASRPGSLLDAVLGVRDKRVADLLAILRAKRITRSDLAQVIHNAQCGCEIGPYSTEGHQLDPIGYTTYGEPAEAVLELLAAARVQLGDQVYELDSLGRRIAERCRWALQGDGHPDPGWSEGEQLGVALVLKDQDTYDRFGLSPVEAAVRFQDLMPERPRDFTVWLAGVFAEVVMPGVRLLVPTDHNSTLGDAS